MISQKYKNKNLDQNFIPREGSFKFSCNQCGECCRNIPLEDKILLSTVDIYRLAKELDMEFADVIEKYCNMMPGQESMLPLVMLKERVDGSCIFLKKGLCSVHAGKPLVCAMSPLGRVLIYHEELKDQKFHYFLKEMSCGHGKDESVTVVDWLARFDVEKYDECMKVYRTIGKECSQLMHMMETNEQKQNMFSAIFYLMYLGYDRNKDLYEQMVENLEFIKKQKGEA